MILTCPACGNRWFTRPDGACNDCGYARGPVMMSDKDRLALREKHERAIAARTLPEGYDQAKKDRDCDDLFGKSRYVDTPQGTRMRPLPPSK